MIYEEDQVDRLWIKQRFPNLFVVPGTIWISGTLVAVPDRDGRDSQRHSERPWTARECVGWGETADAQDTRKSAVARTMARRSPGN
jgi:hypothetical protein